jgi:small redox-active disulfide protein 2
MEEAMRMIKILGTGCPRCDQLAAAAKQAADQLGFEYELDKIKDISEFPAYGLMLTPGLVVDGELIVQGKVPTVDEIKVLLERGA